MRYVIEFGRLASLCSRNSFVDRLLMGFAVGFAVDFLKMIHAPQKIMLVPKHMEQRGGLQA